MVLELDEDNIEYEQPMQALLFGVAAWSTVFVGACATRYLSVLTDSPDEGPTEAENTSGNIAFLPEKHGAPWLPPLRACVLPASRALHRCARCAQVIHVALSYSCSPPSRTW